MVCQTCEDSAHWTGYVSQETQILCKIVGAVEKDDALLFISFLMVAKSEVCSLLGFYILISPMLSFPICE